MAWSFGSKAKGSDGASAGAATGPITDHSVTRREQTNEARSRARAGESGTQANAERHIYGELQGWGRAHN